MFHLFSFPSWYALKLNSLHGSNKSLIAVIDKQDNPLIDLIQPIFYIMYELISDVYEQVTLIGEKTTLSCCH